MSNIKACGLYPLDKASLSSYGKLFACLKSCLIVDLPTAKKTFCDWSRKLWSFFKMQKLWNMG